MVELCNAIAAVYNSSTPLKTAIPGGFFSDREPEGANAPTLFPYAVMQSPSGRSNMAWGGSEYCEDAIRINVTGQGHDVVGAAIELFHNTLKSTLLTLSGSNQHLNVYPMAEPRPLPLAVGVNENAQDMWTWTVTYIFSVRS